MHLDSETIDAIAHRVVELLEPRLTQLAALTPSTGTESPVTPTPGAVDEPRASVLTDTAVDLAEWVNEHHRGWIESLDTPLAEWANMMAAAADATTPAQAIEWAFGENCPTTHWRLTYANVAPPAPARTSRGKVRYGPWLQLLAEHRLAAGPNAGNLQHVDAVVDHINTQINTLGSKQAAVTSSARRNALDLLVDCDGDPDRVLAIADWCLRNKPHWRSTLTGVPRASTFSKMRGDWIASGQDFSLDDLDPDLASRLRHLADGWCFHLSTAMGEPVAAGTTTMRRLHALVAGDGQAAPMDPDVIKDVARWICEPGQGRTRFYVDGLDFPRPDRMRKALLDMRSGPTAQVRGSTVSDTNRAAADATVNTADDDLEGIL